MELLYISISLFLCCSINALILPGTHYCGVGESEEAMDEFGRYENTDYCCKMHDKCSVSIDKFGWRYGIINWRPYAITSCECNMKLLECLREVGSPVSAFVENMFFKVLKVPCLVKGADGYEVKNSLFG